MKSGRSVAFDGMRTESRSWGGEVSGGKGTGRSRQWGGGSAVDLKRKNSSCSHVKSESMCDGALERLSVLRG